MLRYVILVHDWPFLHWDLLLEQPDPGSLLKTWRLLEQPAAGEKVLAEAIPDHRRLYLDYEGPVSGDRGSVSRWDFGTYQMLNAKSFETASDLTFRFTGQKIQGEVTFCEEQGHLYLNVGEKL